MKKIINWTIGSFLRTLFRIVAYLIVGSIIAILCNKIGINLFIDVNASTATNWSQGLPNISRGEFYRCTGNNCTNIGLNDNGLTLEDTSIRRLFSTNNINFDRPVIFQFPTGTLKSDYLYLGEVYICGSKNYSDSSYTIFSAPYSTPMISNSNQIAINYMGLGSRPGADSADCSFKLCRLYSGLFVPNEVSTWASLKLNPNKAINDMHFAIFSYNVRELGIYTDAIKSIIENSNGSVVEAVDKITAEAKKTNDTLNDTDVTDSTNQASDFFNKFDSGDTGSLMNLISLPLKFLNRLNSSCKAVNLPIPHFTNINLPCMSTIYNQNNDFKPVFDIIRLIINGLICYKCLRSLIYFINELKDPEKDNLEVLDL